MAFTFHPICTHEPHPLDRSVYDPFKKTGNNASVAWMKMNSAKTMIMYYIPGIVEAALPPAATPKTIPSGLQSTDISPFNSDIFEKCSDAPSRIKDRPEPGPSLRSASSQPCCPPTLLGTYDFLTIYVLSSR